MNDKINIYAAHIHNDNYESFYSENIINNESLIFCTGREKESLNGWWNFQIDPYDSCVRVKWYEEVYEDSNGRELPVDFNFDMWEKTYVPSCWNNHDDKYLYYEGPVIYNRKFNYKKRIQERVFLRFGSANYEAKVFLNKKYLGMHKGGSTPFCIEITKHLLEKNRAHWIVGDS